MVAEGYFVFECDRCGYREERPRDPAESLGGQVYYPCPVCFFVSDEDLQYIKNFATIFQEETGSALTPDVFKTVIYEFATNPGMWRAFRRFVTAARVDWMREFLLAHDVDWHDMMKQIREDRKNGYDIV